MECVICPLLGNGCWIACPYDGESELSASSSVFDFDHDELCK